jgi:hypothetical protein
LRKVFLFNLPKELALHVRSPRGAFLTRLDAPCVPSSSASMIDRRRFRGNRQSSAHPLRCDSIINLGRKNADNGKIGERDSRECANLSGARLNPPFGSENLKFGQLFAVVLRGRARARREKAFRFGKCICEQNPCKLIYYFQPLDAARVTFRAKSCRGALEK